MLCSSVIGRRGVVRRVGENELRVILEMTLANADVCTVPDTRRERLVRALVRSLERLEIWRDDSLHERVIAPLPLFPTDDMHLRGLAPGEGVTSIQ